MEEVDWTLTCIFIFFNELAGRSIPWFNMWDFPHYPTIQVNAIIDCSWATVYQVGWYYLLWGKDLLYDGCHSWLWMFQPIISHKPHQLPINHTIRTWSSVAAVSHGPHFFALLLIINDHSPGLPQEPTWEQHHLPTYLAAITALQHFIHAHLILGSFFVFVFVFLFG